MICNKCGENISDEAKFCTGCGAKAERDEVSEAVEAPTETAAPETAQAPTEAEIPETAQVPTEAEIPETVQAPTEAEVPETVQAPTEAEVPETAQAPAETAVPETKSVPKKTGAGRLLGAAVISVFAIVFLTVFNVLLCGRIGLSSDIIENSAKKLNIDTILALELYDGSTLADEVHYLMGTGFASRTNAQPGDIAEFLSESDIVDTAAEKLGLYAGYFINGRDVRTPVEVTDADVIDFFKRNSIPLQLVIGDYTPDNADYEDICRSMENKGFFEALSIREWSDSLGFSVKNFRFVFSLITIGVIFALVLVLFIWIAIVLDKRSRHIFGFFGTITLVCGLILLVPSAAFLLGAPFIAVYMGNAMAYILSVVLMPTLLLALCTGVFELVLSVIFRAIKRNIKKRELKANGGV